MCCRPASPSVHVYASLVPCPCLSHTLVPCPAHPPPSTRPPPQGQHIALEVTPTGDVLATPMDAPTNGAGSGAGARQPHRLTLAQPAGWAGWAVSEAQFAPGEQLDTLPG